MEITYTEILARGGVSLFSNIYPTFEKGRVLKSTMLENLRDYPRDFTELYYQDYSDGIVVGTTISVQESFLVISKGMVKFNGRIYALETDFELPYSATGKETIIKVKFHDEQIHPDFIAFQSTIFLDDNRSLQNGELELGRFKLKEGARLRCQFEDFYDFATEFNTINYIHCQYAGIQTSTIHPLILRSYAKEILKHQLTNCYDISFAMQCLNNGRMEREVILFYIGNRLGVGYKDWTNEQIHQQLGYILQEVKGGKQPPRGLVRSQRMIVD